MIILRPGRKWAKVYQETQCRKLDQSALRWKSPDTGCWDTLWLVEWVLLCQGDWWRCYPPEGTQHKHPRHHWVEMTTCMCVQKHTMSYHTQIWLSPCHSVCGKIFEWRLYKNSYSILIFIKFLTLFITTCYQWYVCAELNSSLPGFRKVMDGPRRRGVHWKCWSWSQGKRLVCGGLWYHQHWGWTLNLLPPARWIPPCTKFQA